MKTRVKVICLALFIISLLAALLTNNHPASRVEAFSVGPNAGHTGAPNELTCATTGCHSGLLNAGTGHLTIEAPSVYEPGETYTITVKHTATDNSRRRWGFQLTALSTDNHKAGDLQNMSGTTQILDGGPDGTRQYIEHNFNGTFQGQRNGASWSFKWTAPAEDIGAVTLYAAGNQANNDGNNTGDQIYTAEVFIFSGPPKILSARIKGKALNISGENFADGAALFLCEACDTPATEGSRVKKTGNDPDNPATLITARKAGKTIAPGQTVVLQVRNPDDTVSEPFLFRRDE